MRFLDNTMAISGPGGEDPGTMGRSQKPMRHIAVNRVLRVAPMPQTPSRRQLDKVARPRAGTAGATIRSRGSLLDHSPGTPQGGGQVMSIPERVSRSRLRRTSRREHGAEGRDRHRRRTLVVRPFPRGHGAFRVVISWHICGCMLALLRGRAHTRHAFASAEDGNSGRRTETMLGRPSQPSQKSDPREPGMGFGSRCEL